MKHILFLLLMISVSLNVALMWPKLGLDEERSVSPPSHEGQVSFSNPQVSPKEAPTEDSRLDEGLNQFRQVQLQQIEQYIAVDQAQEALFVVQQYLSDHPDDIVFLFWEAKLTDQLDTLNQALHLYYRLLQHPMTKTQREQIQAQVSQRLASVESSLKQASAWDVLASLWEVQWQWYPSDKQVMLDLAEAYGMQQQWHLMDSVVAGLPADDPELMALLERFDWWQEQNTKQGETAQASPQTDDWTRIALTKIGEHYLVNVELNHQPLSLMIDTGATTSVLGRDALERVTRALPSTRHPESLGDYRVNTAGGAAMAELFEFNQFNMGPFIQQPIAVLVMDTSFTADGLLGMNVLREFQFQIDQQQQQLLLKPLN